jgi:hypothetical protein
MARVMMEQEFLYKRRTGIKEKWNNKGVDLSLRPE